MHGVPGGVTDRLHGWTTEAMDRVEIDLTPVMAPVPREVRHTLEALLTLAAIAPLPLVPLGLWLASLVATEPTTSADFAPLLIATTLMVAGPPLFFIAMVTAALSAKRLLKDGPRSTRITLDASGLTVEQRWLVRSTRDRLPLGAIVEVTADEERLVVRSTERVLEIPVVGRSRATLEAMAAVVEAHMARFAEKQSRADVPRTLARMVREG